MRNKKYDIPILAIVIVLMFSWAYGANYIIHDFTTGKMHEAKDLYRTNGRTVENDIGSNEVRIASLQTQADSTEAALLQQIYLLASDYYSAAVVNGYLNLKANVVDVYTKTAADLLLADKATTAAVALKQNASDMINYYTKTAVDLLLADKATTGAVALKLDAVTINDYYPKTETYNTGEIAAQLAAKANTADVYTTAEINLMLTDYETTGAVAIHIADKGAHSFPDPTGQPINRLPVTNGAGGWDYTSFGAAGAGVTNAVDLIVASPAADGLPSHNQQTFNDTMIVELNKIWTTDGSQDVALNVALITNDSQDVALNARKIQADSADVALNAANITNDSQDVALNARQIQADSADVALNAAKITNDSQDVAINGRTTTGDVNSLIAAATAECQAKTWTPLVMADGAYTGEVIIDTVAASQTVYNVVYSSSTGWAAAKADADSTLPALGMALETGTGDKKILLRGIVKNTSWNFTKGNLIYVSTATAGAVTAVKPSATGNRVQIIGVALSANVILFNPTSLWIEI